MNFDTKYLIRWGIPGWTMVMVLSPYMIVTYFDFLSKQVYNASDLLAIGAVLTVLGVPLGYLLNQIHHSLFWVLPRVNKDKWTIYFDEELDIDEYFADDNEDGMKDALKERYRYLLSKKHELGGIVMSLGISAFVILIFNCTMDEFHAWCWWYFIILLALFTVLLLSRQYSSENIDRYHNHYLNKQRQNDTST
ncbi:hypothetical protein ACIQZD_22130 [Peribacillus sp. NPDC096447]|uniref:hypothetical protein n=1 Tax=Peribacillus sp. NPDC096447 TaxID=3364394 RepID=UPI00381E43A5